MDAPRVWVHFGHPIHTDREVGTWSIIGHSYLPFWRFHCCRCGKRGPFLKLFDVHPKAEIMRPNRFAMVCATCLIEILTFIVEANP